MGVGRLVRHRASFRGHLMRTFQQLRGNLVQLRRDFVTSMVLPPGAASGGFFQAKAKIPGVEVSILMDFDTFRSNLSQNLARSSNPGRSNQYLSKSYQNVDLAREVSTFLTNMLIWHERGEGKVPTLREGCLRHAGRPAARAS